MPGGPGGGGGWPGPFGPGWDWPYNPPELPDEPVEEPYDTPKDDPDKDDEDKKDEDKKDEENTEEDKERNRGGWPPEMTWEEIQEAKRQGHANYQKYIEANAEVLPGSPILGQNTSPMGAYEAR